MVDQSIISTLDEVTLRLIDVFSQEFHIASIVPETRFTDNKDSIYFLFKCSRCCIFVNKRYTITSKYSFQVADTS